MMLLILNEFSPFISSLAFYNQRVGNLVRTVFSIFRITNYIKEHHEVKEEFFKKTLQNVNCSSQRYGATGYAATCDTTSHSGVLF